MLDKCDKRRLFYEGRKNLQNDALKIFRQKKWKLSLLDLE